MHIRGWRWSEGFICLRCQTNWHSEFRRDDRLYFQCDACRYQCSPVSGSVFESSKLPLPEWCPAMHLMTQAKNNVSALELKRHLGVSYPTAWLLMHKLIEVTFQREESRRPFTKESIQALAEMSLAGAAGDVRLMRDAHPAHGGGPGPAYPRLRFPPGWFAVSSSSACTAAGRGSAPPQASQS